MPHPAAAAPGPAQHHQGLWLVRVSCCPSACTPKALALQPSALIADHWPGWFRASIPFPSVGFAAPSGSPSVSLSQTLNPESMGGAILCGPPPPRVSRPIRLDTQARGCQATNQARGCQATNARGCQATNQARGCQATNQARGCQATHQRLWMGLGYCPARHNPCY